MIIDADNWTEQGGVPGPWLHRLPHFRLDATPSVGDEIQTEYFVPREHGAAALHAVRRLGERIDPHLVVTELRTMAADDLWLSGAYDRATLAIHFTWLPHPDAVAALLPAIESALAPFGARPHWGKWHLFDAGAIRQRAPAPGLIGVQLIATRQRLRERAPRAARGALRRRGALDADREPPIPTAWCRLRRPGR